MTMNRMISLLLLPLLCGACLSPVKIQTTSFEQRQWLLSGEALPGVATEELALEDERVLYVTKEMQDFAREAVEGLSGRERITGLLQALVHPSGLNLQYDSEASFTAEEVFSEGRANCLSFTNIFIAMGRYLDMDVQYNEVDVPPIWDLRSGNTMVLNKHINAMVTRIGSRHVVDLNIEEYEPYYEQRYIDDRLAVAQHYNNKAMAYLVEQDYAQALRFMRKALFMEPGVSYLWNNLGSMYRRAGNLKAAELSYLAAIEADEDDLVALSNAARLYRDIGNTELATHFSNKAHAFRMQNPYFIFGMAQMAFLENDYETAQEHVSEAISLNDQEHRFYFLQGAIYEKTGMPKLASDNFNKALELSGDKKQQARYRSKMHRLAAAKS